VIGALDVALHGVRIGELIDVDGAVEFRFLRDYWRMPRRPVLGQWFEDGAGVPPSLRAGVGLPSGSAVRPRCCALALRATLRSPSRGRAPAG
jgi:hypothetical protein